MPDWARQVARANRAMQPAAELPIMERLSCASWYLLGREQLEVPRALSAIAWIAAAIPIYFLATRLASAAAALVSVAVWLFLPYGIVASRAFQPDPLMTCCSVWALLALVRHDERSTSRRLVVAAVAVAVAAVVKPMSVFVTLPVLVGLAVARHGWRTLQRRSFWALCAIAVLPAGLYYGYGMVLGTLTRDQMHVRFVPSLVATSLFWNGLWTQIQRVFTLPFFAAAVLGAILMRRSPLRTLVFSLFAGYALFAFAFTYHVPTHNYYHLPYIAAVALGVTALCGWVEARVSGPTARRVAPAALVAVVAAIALWGSLAAWRRFDAGNAFDRIARFEQIGELVQHETRVIFLDGEYGYPLMYHGQISGDSWPTIDDLRAESIDGRAHVDAEARFARDFSGMPPRYFVVTDLYSLDQQPDLQHLLNERAEVIDSSPTDRIYRFKMP